MKPRLLDLFCGRGGWSKAFLALGWECVGVEHPYPGQLIRADVFELERCFIDSFDAVVASPPCEEFARAWLPWLRCDRTPSPLALSLLCWSVALCDRPRRIVECSKFAARHLPGSSLVKSWALWGDVPVLLPRDFLVQGKEKLSGRCPSRRAEIPWPLALSVARAFTQSL